MAEQTPKMTTRIELSLERRMLLRHLIRIWRSGDVEDLKEPDRHRDPQGARRRVAAYDKLIEALAVGHIELPDEETRAVLAEAADDYEEAGELAELRLYSEAQKALLAVFEDPTGKGDDTSAGGKPQTAIADDSTQSAVLELVLESHPAQLTRQELLLELVGVDPTFGARDDIERAIKDLAGAGLLHTQGGFLSPTRAAVRSAKLRAEL